MDLFTLEKTLFNLQSNPAVSSSADSFLLVNNVLSTLQSIQGIYFNLNSDHINDNYKKMMIQKTKEFEEIFITLVFERLETIGLRELLIGGMFDNKTDEKTVPYNMITKEIVGKPNSQRQNAVNLENLNELVNQTEEIKDKKIKLEDGKKKKSLIGEEETVEIGKIKNKLRGIASSQDDGGKMDFNASKDEKASSTAGRDYLLSILNKKSD